MTSPATEPKQPPESAGGTRLAALLRTWSAAAANMMAGRWIAGQGEAAAGVRPDGLTITIGLDALQARRSGGDLAVSVCADDALVVASVTRAFMRLAAPTARARWTHNGFSPSAAASLDAAATPRNLDGTDNPVDSRLELAGWADRGTTSSWMTGGTYVVVRRIRMLLSRWDRQSIQARERVIGRTLDTGAPLSGGDEHAAPDFAARTSTGALVVATDAHLRLTHPANNSGATMLRRAFSYDDGVRADGEPDAGLFFQAYQSDPHASFVPIQRKLAASDALRHFVVHEASALFAIAPGTSEGGWAAQPLLSR